MFLVSETRERKKVDSGEESQDALKEMFDRIQGLTGEENLELLDTRFIQGQSSELSYTQTPEMLRSFWSHQSESW